jgi:uncharacterized OB-fold protein
LSEEKSFTVKSFYDYLAIKKLMGINCIDCGNLMVPPRMVCSECSSNNIEWYEFKGNGTLQTFSVVNVGPSSLKDKVPYGVGVIKLDEGPMITGRLIGFNPKEPEKIQVGMKVKADFVPELGQTILAFKLS